MFNKFTLRRAMAATLLGLLTVSNAHACDPSFKLVNNTSWTIQSVFAREYGDTGWSADLLGRAVVRPAGDNRTLNLEETQVRRYDVELIFSINGTQNVQIWQNVGLCTTAAMNVYYTSTGFQADWQ